MSIGPGSTSSAPRSRRRLRLRRGSFAWWVFLAVLLVPIAEVAVIISVGRVIGAWPTVLLLVAESALGAWLVKREGARAWGALRTALSTGRMPSGELADGALVLVGGTLLLTPGFLTDVVGFAAILPVTRPLARAALAKVIERRLVTVVGPVGAATIGGVTGSFGRQGPGPAAGPRTGPAAGQAFTPPSHAGATAGARGQDDDVIEGEIL